MNTNVLRELRKYLYGLAIAFIPIAVYFGWLDVEASVLVVPLLVAIFNLTPKDLETSPVEIEAPASPEVIDISSIESEAQGPKHAAVE